MTNPKFLISLIVAVLLVTAGMVGTFVFRSTAKTATISDGEGDPVSHTPRVISDVPTNSLTTGPVGDSIRYYEVQTGHAFQYDLLTQKTTVLSDTKLSGFVRTVWSPDRQQVLTTFAQPSGTVIKWFEYQTGRSAALPKGTQRAVFSPDGRHIATVSSDTDAQTISISNPDGTDAHSLLHTRASDIDLAWPQADLIVMTSHTDTGDSLTGIGMDGTLTPILSSLQNLEYTWLRDGTKLLYSSFTNTNGIQISYLDLHNRASVPLGISTSARKCAWHPDGSTVTCGVPHNTALAKDVSADHSATSDDIVTIDIITGAQEKIYGAQSATYLGVIDPLISPAASAFLFTNLFDQKLYAVSL